MTQYPYRRNPIIQHGKMSEYFAQIPNDLARDEKLSHHAYRIAIVMRTHRHGWQVSAKSLAETYRWGRTSVAKALDELVGAGWLAIRRYENADGHRLFDEYHVHVSRRFTPEETTEWSRTVVLDGQRDSDEDMSLSLAEPARCTETRHLHVANGATKEHQPEHHSEAQPEDQTPECWICEGSGVFDGGPCEGCARDQSNNAATDGFVQSRSDETGCKGCEMFGPEGCIVHTSAPVGQRQSTLTG